MLEIILLRSLYRKLSAMAVEKGRPGSWGWLGVLLWVGGEIVGFIIGAAMNLELGSYGLALALAACGAGVSYAVVNSLGSMDTDGDGRDTGGVGRFDPENPYSPPGTMNKR